ncbi:hypothetical protein [Microbacterium sp. SS28]|uniref:hypothetical protein n=1 Tax=Microbacterium sp. SS28 TaxID=2919948 RepID=UPI001FAA7FDD|nr:hypothetical protein [Microbacterium sp. SS28]
MMATGKRNRRGVIWALLGAGVLAIAIIAIVVSGLFGQSPSPSGTSEPAPDPSSTTTSTSSPRQAVVDESATENGWIPEPITTDPDPYIRDALAAASTFDTQKSTRNEWLSYLDTWFTPDTRYTSEQDREDDMRASQLELRQGVVLPEDEWTSLANEDGRVVAAVPGDVTYSDVPDDTSGDMTIGTADVILTYTRADASGKESSYDETVRVSVQVLCGEGSIPTPDSAQQPGDCKVVRYFSGSLEP